MRTNQFYDKTSWYLNNLIKASIMLFNDDIVIQNEFTLKAPLFKSNKIWAKILFISIINFETLAHDLDGSFRPENSGACSYE